MGDSLVEKRNVYWHTGQVLRTHRENMLRQRGMVLWLSGLSGSGKSTLAHALEAELHALGRLTYTLDGDNIRHGLNSDLGFSQADRRENLRRIGEVAKLMLDSGVIVLAAFISPLRAEREQLRAVLGADYIEVFVDCPLAVCEQRDPKALYAKARAGLIPEFTGISAPYEPPQKPEIVVRTAEDSVAQCLAQLLAYINERTGGLEVSAARC
ncbi:adenylyl-sulfate kinase [Peptococcaceae bacterium CEB3]|nr:adenylyl-sulfate kinase [Peptococcaceae bacterium CEB3]